MRPSQVRRIIRALELLAAEPESIIVSHDDIAQFNSDGIVDYKLFKALKEEHDAQP